MLNDSNRKRVLENWQRTVEEITATTVKVGRLAADVRIIGVSKYVDVETTIALRDAGCRELGEARPQQLVEKATAIERKSVTWHLIGHLQRNKAKRVVELADMIHSVDSMKLLESITAYSAQVERSPSLLIEVNISGEIDKHGFDPRELLSLWPQIMAAKNVPIVGLMAMAGMNSRGVEARQQFAAVRELRDTIEARYGARLPELSMGMSGDFGEAIREGSTMLRIGSRLFEGVSS